MMLKVVSESPFISATSVQIFVFLRHSILDLGPVYATDGETDVRQHNGLMLPDRGRA